MSDKQKVLLTLALVSETCAACLTSLDQGPSPTSTAAAPISVPASTAAPSLSVLRKDLLTLLTLTYATTTKVSLALKPPTSAYSACLPQLQDLSRHVSALTTCTTLFDETAHGATLVKLVRGATRDVLGSVGVYARAFSDITQKDGNGSRGSVEDYLVRTGAVHDAVEQARREIPTDNISAVRTLWGRDRDMLDDSFIEVTEMLEDGDEDEEDEDDFGDEDDEWDELGLGKKKKMSELELARTKSIHRLLRLSVMLHKRIHIDLLQEPPKEVVENTHHAPVDALPGLSHRFLLATEELVAALYAPQDPANLRIAVETLVNEAQAFEPTLRTALFLQSSSPEDDLQRKMADVTVTEAVAETETESADDKKRKERRKWFDTCVDQVDKISQRVLAELESDAQ